MSDDLSDLVAGLTETEVAALVEDLPEPIAAALLDEITAGVGWRGLPTGPIEQAQMLDEPFTHRAHLELLDRVITEAVRDVEEGRNRRIVIAMPPRSGKTYTTTLLTPAWIMATHPNWPLALTSHDGGLATGWGRQVRRWVESGRLGGHVQVAPDAGAASAWETTEGGKMLSISIRESFTGRGAKVLIIDDPHKDFVDAHSAVMRQNVWDWWLSVAQTRLEPPYLVIVIMCMTGDTPVLMADGTERPLADVRPGDEIATYEDGHLSTSRVLNWANQGPDTIYEIRMKSGITVRANARHPFLTIEDGVETWQRTDRLEPGSKVLRAEGRGPVPPAPSATGQPSARASARRTMARPAGLLAYDPRRVTPSLDALLGSSTATASRSRSTTRFLPSRPEDAPYAARMNARLDQHTGLGSASTTTTTPGESEGSSATTATSSSSSTSPPSASEPPPTTWSVTPDVVESVTLAGTEDVYDLQVERTENFIANGLVSHNTRWHEDDLVGRLLSKEYEGNPADWTVIRIPAIAESEDDPLGRAIGEPLISPLLPDETAEQALQRWREVEQSVGSYVWASMYQQRPSPAQGSIFNVDTLRYWTVDLTKATDDGQVRWLDPDLLATGRWLDSWDMSFKATSTSDYVVGQRWCRIALNRYLIAQQRDRWTFTQTLARVLAWSNGGGPYGHLVHERLVEDKANGPAVIDVLKERVVGLRPVNPEISKEARARAITPEVESGHVYLPHPSDPGNEWVKDLLSELRNFPRDIHDDMVDALVHALTRLRDTGRGSVGNPSGTPIERDLAGAARSTSRRLPSPTSRAQIVRGSGR